MHLKKECNVTVVAVTNAEGKTHINPKERTLEKGDMFVIIAEHDYEG